MSLQFDKIIIAKKVEPPLKFLFRFFFPAMLKLFVAHSADTTSVAINPS
jgi:hypothetical protein